MGLSVSNYQDADYPIVVVGEAAVSVDADNEQYVQEAISELCQGNTQPVIAHWLKLHADKFLVAGGMAADLCL